MKKNHRGFSAIEGLLILIIVGLIGFVGWYVYHSKNTSDKTYTSVDKSSSANSGSLNQVNKSYTDPSKKFSLLYLNSWTVNEISVGVPSGHMLEFLNPVSTTIVPPNNSWIDKDKQTPNGVFVSAYKSADTQSVLNEWSKTRTASNAPNAVQLNGYKAIFQQYVDSSSTEGVYFITEKGITVALSFTEKQKGTTGSFEADFDNTKLVPDFEKIAKSIKFLQ